MVRSAHSYRAEAEQHRARGWTYRQVAAEWKRRYGFNSRVAFRLAHGLTQAEVAGKWNEQWPEPNSPKTAKQISYWEIWPGPGGRTPSLETMNKLAYLYQCSAGDLLDGEDYSHLDPAYTGDVPVDSQHQRLVTAPEPLPAIDPTLVDLPPAAAITAVSGRLVEDFDMLTDTYRRMDYRSGAPSVAGDVSNHLRRMLEVSSRTTSDSAHQHLLLAIGDAAQLAAWLSIDAQHYDRAHAYCQLAVSVAKKGNNRPLHAYALGVASYIYLHAGDGAAALRLLDSADGLATRGIPAAVRSWLSEARGEAYAFARDPRAGLRALNDAERTFDSVTVENTPGWLAFFNADCHAARLKGRCLVRLRRPREAVPALFEALNLLPLPFVRERSGTLIDLAFAYVQLKEIEEACTVARQATELARRTQSERNLKRLRELLLELMPWTDLGCVQDLYRQLLLN
jgi:tetratricopeptide (TPR) repeat protein